MRGRIGCCILLCAALLWTGTGCARRDQQEQAENLARQSLSQNFQTTAKVRYKGIETVMTIYKKPMNCAVVTFEAPDSLMSRSPIKICHSISHRTAFPERLRQRWC